MLSVMNRMSGRLAFAALAAFLLSSVLCACGSDKAGGSPAGNAANKDPKDGKGGKKEDRPAVLDAVLAMSVPIPVEVTGAGTLQALDEVDLRAEVAGRIASIAFQEGRDAAAGTILIKLDDAVLQAQKARAAAQVRRQETTLGRRRQELSIKATSQQEVDLVEADLAVARADLALVEAQIRATEVRAPFAGRLGFRSVSIGQVVTAGQVLGRITRTSPLRVELAVPEERSIGLRTGGIVSFKVLGRMETFRAKVDVMEPRLDEATRTVKIRARYEGREPLVPGSSVTVTLSQGMRQGIRVPAEALSGDAKGAILYVLKNGQAKACRVEVGARDASRIEIFSGVAPGDTVLLVGASGLRPGKAVKVARLVAAP